MRAQRQAFVSRHSLVVAALIAVFGPLCYWAWAAVWDRSVDPIGLLVAAVAPFIVVMALAWLWYRVQAPAAVYAPLREFHDSQRPPCPYTATAWVQDDQITFSLFASNRYSAVPAIESARCDVHTKDNHASSSRTFGRTDVSAHNGPTASYPNDFEHPAWPLEPGNYEAVWTLRNAEGNEWHIGCRFRVR